MKRNRRGEDENNKTDTFYNYGDTPEDGSKIEWNEHSVEICKFWLDKTKSEWERQNKILKAFLAIGCLLFSLSFAFNSLYCPCGSGSFSCLDEILAIIHLAYTAIWIVVDLILLAKDPETYFSKKYSVFRRMMDAAFSVAEKCARLGQYYSCLIVSYEKAKCKLKKRIVYEIVGLTIGFILLLISVILRYRL